MAEIMVFRPTLDEFKNFSNYITYMESKGAHLAGIAKIIPPKEWKPRINSCNDEEIMSLKIPNPIRQVAEGKCGVYEMKHIPINSMTVEKFKNMAESDDFKLPDIFTYDEVERKYWKSIVYKPPIYGADVPGSITDKSLKIWNINKLGSILDFVDKYYGVTIAGVNTAYLYFGMWKSSFAWHTEDMELYSINYIHDGYPKTWYAVPPKYGFRLGRLAAGFFPAEAQKCHAFLRHKTSIIAPFILRKNAIPINKIVQEKGEIMITFPFGYHAGFNHGFNIAESTNFALPRWVEYGKRSLLCNCREDMVKINMDIFVKRLQPEKYKKWRKGEDIGHHPEDMTRLYAAPKPQIDDSYDEENSSSQTDDNEDVSGSEDTYHLEENDDLNSVREFNKKKKEESSIDYEPHTNSNKRKIFKKKSRKSSKPKMECKKPLKIKTKKKNHF